MNLEKIKDTARKHEQKEDWRKAIEVYQKAIQEFESVPDAVPDVSIYNRIGDLHLKVNDTASAVQVYERAVDIYADQGFSNNAIALCGKILRVNPGRVQTYLKLAYLNARKNVVIEAKKNLLEYLDRMNAGKHLDEAFEQVKKFAEHFPDNQELRQMLGELLRAASRKSSGSKEHLSKLADELTTGGGAAADDVRGGAGGGPQPSGGRPGDLVFLDVGGAPPPPRRPAASPPGRPAAPPPGKAGPVRGSASTRVSGPTTRAGSAAPRPASPPSPPKPTAPPRGAGANTGDLDIVPTSLSGEGAVDSGRLEGLELTGFGADSGLSPVDDLVIDQGSEAGSLDLAATDDSIQRSGSDDLGSSFEIDLSGRDDDVSLDSLPSGRADFGTGDLILADGGNPSADLAGGGEDADGGIGLDNELSADLALDDALSFGEMEEPTQPGIAELEERILDDPENPELHRALGEALLAGGETARGLEELDLALVGYETVEDWNHSLDVVNELIRLDPGAVRYYQKRVELSYRAGDRPRLIEAYLELGDALVRSGALDKAIAVYRRVAEHEPNNRRAAAALQSLAPPEEPPAKPPAARKSGPLSVPKAVPAAPRPTAPKAPPAPRPAAKAPPAEDAGGFVDLGAMVLDETAPLLDARMRVEDEQPTGDEQRDFEEMLAQFKQGIDRTIDVEDFQSHYDLGVAFKEMGLLDEAIAEFQKALRASEGRLRTSEALGVSFFEKGQPAIAEPILRRAVESLPGDDHEKIGLLYWLGRALEEQSRVAEALPFYERAMAVDIQFQDLQSRVGKLAAGR